METSNTVGRQIFVGHNDFIGVQKTTQLMGNHIDLGRIFSRCGNSEDYSSVFQEENFCVLVFGVISPVYYVSLSNGRKWSRKRLIASVLRSPKA